MSTDNAVDHDTVPPANKGLLVAAGVLLAIPMIALAWVGSYSKETPKLGAFPFFIWYQFMWVFLCSFMTYGAYRLVLAARPHRPMPGHPDHPGGPDTPDSTLRRDEEGLR